jgi:hypothetical protein
MINTSTVIPKLISICSLTEQMIALDDIPSKPYVRLAEHFNSALNDAKLDRSNLHDQLLWIKNYAYRIVIEAPIKSEKWEELLLLISDLNDSWE